MAELSVVGKSVPRVDALVKVTGSAEFVSDMKVPGMLYVKVLRSPYPHAKIISIDTSKAEQLAGVICVVTGKDAPEKKSGSAILDQPVLARDVVCAVGDPVAAVAAKSLDIAEEALELITVKYEELPIPLGCSPDHGIRQLLVR
ncbi:Caffeine dehydrogenase subunit alpha [subsurface metagenome]